MCDLCFGAEATQVDKYGRKLCQECFFDEEFEESGDE
jgi:hypothetical protein